jgi:4-hydroxybenzoyl-CoA thioesterase
MPRIRIDIPEVAHFSTDIPIRISDINYGNHLGHDAVLSLAHEARVRFLAMLGFSELDVDGAGLIMADAAVMYRSEAFYGETLRVDVSVATLEGAGLTLLYRMSVAPQGREVARVQTGMVFFDYEKKRPVPVPPAFGGAVGALRNR